MSNKSDYTSEEWQSLLKAPGLAGMIVALSSPNGPIGAAKESMAISRLILESKQQSSSNELVKSITDDLMTSEGRRSASMMDLLGKKPEVLKDLAMSNLTQVRGIVASKSEADSQALTAWLSDLAKRVSEAANEGGFFGFGGTQVNDAERAALAQINKALS